MGDYPSVAGQVDPPLAAGAVEELYRWRGFEQRLPAQSQPLDDLFVALGVTILEVIKQSAARVHHHQETASRSMIFLVSLKMLRQLSDPLAENSDLDLRRSRILLV